MKRYLGIVAAATVFLAGCGSADDSAADMSPTLEGSGDMSSAAGAGAAPGAMDGGEAGDDGAAPVAEGEGGPSDALDEEAPPAR